MMHSFMTMQITVDSLVSAFFLFYIAHITKAKHYSRTKLKKNLLKKLQNSLILFSRESTQVVE